MTPYEEKKLFRELKELRNQLNELKEMLNPYAPQKDEFVGTRQAARDLGVSVRKLRYQLANNELPFATRPDGKHWKFSKHAIQMYLSKR